MHSATNIASKIADYCSFCHDDLAGKEYYVVNSLGGYGRNEVLICIPCLKKDENKNVKNLLSERGQLEERDL